MIKKKTIQLLAGCLMITNFNLFGQVHIWFSNTPSPQTS